MGSAIVKSTSIGLSCVLEKAAMKTLHLIRHAKSSWNNSALADIDRPLNKRGFASCEVMAARVLEAGCTFEHTFCSPAVRAQSTIEEISYHLEVQGISIAWKIVPALYTFDVRELLQWCQQVDKALQEIVVVGHNPAITELCNALGDEVIENVPTCGYVQLAFEEEWRSLSADSAKLICFLKPKMFMGKSESD